MNSEYMAHTECNVTQPETKSQIMKIVSKWIGQEKKINLYSMRSYGPQKINVACSLLYVGANYKNVFVC